MERLERRVTALEPQTVALHVLRPLAEVEREHILATLAAQGGQIALTAETLGISVPTLYRRLREYGGQRG